MPDSVAIVGGGLGGFIAHATLVHGGVPPEDVTVFDATGVDPAAAWRVRAASIRQQHMRSESDGHCLPTRLSDPVDSLDRGLDAGGAGRCAIRYGGDGGTGGRMARDFDGVVAGVAIAGDDVFGHGGAEGFVGHRR